ncbi:MAG: T9SS type A sorting domain-containing protein [Chitinivibrionales bacterium]|nr:T9SS type A sorting domain-containing protein [Chitinivibrionales bacterium]
MMLRRVSCVFICLLAALFSVASATALVGNPKTAFTLQGEQLQSVSIQQSFTSDHEVVGTTIPINHHSAIFGAGVTATVKLHNDVGLARVILIDDFDEEYMVYEVYSLLVDDYTISVQNAAIETRILDGVTPKSYRIELVNATLDLQSTQFALQPPVERAAITDIQKQIALEQQNLRIDLINTQIKKKGLTWTAGPNEASIASYAKRKCLFGHYPMLGNTQGFEYHADGVFNLKNNDPEIDIQAAREAAENPSSVISSFDWRNRHGATNSQSPYYNKKSSVDGWCSPVKNQGSCGSCWAHSTLSTAEAVVNLYFNQHLDVDLSEQYIMECGQGGASAGKGCSGGYTAKALSWVASHGVIDEASFPYTASDAPTCGDTSKSPKELVKFTGSVTAKPSGADALKKELIQYGPLNVSVTSLSHGMSLVAFNGSTYIFKNSWGPSNQAYKSVSPSSLNDFAEVSTYKTPAISRNYTEKDIKCLDADKDGYYNWGIGTTKPSTCPGDITAEKDCDDFNAGLGPMDTDGSCKKITTGLVMHPLKNSKIYYNCIQNPVNRTTIINFETPANAKATVRIFDMSGALVKSLPVNQEQSGVHQVVWNGTNDRGGVIGNGLYVCRISVDNNNVSTLSSFKIVISH